MGIARLTVVGITAGLVLSALALTSVPLALVTSAALTLSLLAAISLGEPKASAKEVERVFALCGVDALLRELPEGGNTRIAEGGMSLSPGQRARIALARALMGNPLVLLLDEADGNLDPHAADIVERVVADFSGTVILVTHKLERLAVADCVWHLESGRLIESGAPGEVFSRDGPTARLFRLPIASHASR